MSNSWSTPQLTVPIGDDVPNLQEKLVALAKHDPTSIADIPVGAMRMYEVSSGKWQTQKYNGTSWETLPFLQHNVDQLDGYHAAITPSANTVAVRNASGKLEGDITGNAATAGSAVTLSQSLPVDKGGTGATTSAQARTNLGVPPTSHTSTATTYGVGNSTHYGHTKLSDATDSSSGVSGGVAATPAAVKATKEVADSAQSAADNAQSAADAAMAKASTIATTSTPGIVMPQTGDDDGLELGADGTLRVRQAGATQRGSVLASTTAQAGAVPMAGANGKIGSDWMNTPPVTLFNTRIVITESSAAWTPPVSGWARVTVIGGGGAGTSWLAGSGNRLAWGTPGGDTKFGDITARGGATSRPCSAIVTITDRYRVGGGCAGEVVTDYIYLNTDVSIAVVIGAGGIAGPGTSLSGFTGSPGTVTFHDIVYVTSSYGQGWGGDGGRTGLGYGGGGGACGLTYGAESIPIAPHNPGLGHDGGKDSIDSTANPQMGGDGGHGAVIIEYYDPNKEAA